MCTAPKWGQPPSSFPGRKYPLTTWTRHTLAVGSGKEGGGASRLSKKKTQEGDTSVQGGGELVYRLCMSSQDNSGNSAWETWAPVSTPCPRSVPTQKANKPQRETCPLKCQTPRVALEHGHAQRFIQTLTLLKPRSLVMGEEG